MTSTSRQIQVRWPDIDALGHVNHSVVLVYLEVGRDAVLAEHSVAGADYVVRHCDIDYVSELRPTSGYAEYRLDGLVLGRTSIRLTERLVDAHGQTAVTASFVLVMWDTEKRMSRELTDSERHMLGKLEVHHDESPAKERSF